MPPWIQQWMRTCSGSGEGLGKVNIFLPLLPTCTDRFSNWASWIFPKEGFQQCHLLPVYHLGSHTDSSIPCILIEYLPCAKISPSDSRQLDRHGPCYHAAYILQQGKQRTKQVKKKIASLLMWKAQSGTSARAIWQRVTRWGWQLEVWWSVREGSSAEVACGLRAIGKVNSYQKSIRNRE